MVKRFPHIATVYAGSASVQDGQYIETVPSTMEITGRLVMTGENYLTKADGDQVQYSAKFFTRTGPPEVDADLLEVDSVKYSVVLWRVYQSHNVIFLK